MIPQEPTALPADVNSVRELFLEWRRTKKRGAPIPDALWSDAVNAARKHGLKVVSRALSIEYGVLRGRMGTEDADRPADFVELKAMPLPGVTEVEGSVVEVVDSDGARMMIRLSGHGPLDLVGLVNAFRRPHA